jgi:diguanylate cyclase (GGDEF)-like protein/PAS domain S-box-containing protein
VAEQDFYARLLADNSLDVVYHSVDGLLAWVSPSIEPLLGWRPDEVLGRPTSEFWHSDDVDMVAQLRNESLLGDDRRGVFRMRAKDGRQLWVHITLHGSLGPDGRPETTGSVRDVTAEHGALANLEAERSTARAVLDSLLDPHVILEAIRDGSGTIVDFRYTEANDAACRDDRMERDQLVGARLMDLFPGHGPAGLLDDLRLVVETGVPLVRDDLRYRQERRDAVGWYDVRAVRVGDGLSYTWRDVSDRHRSQVQLAGSERRYRLLAENVSDTVMHASSGTILWVSQALNATLGWDPEDWVGHSFREFSHPDDIPSLVAAQTALALGETVVSRVRARAADCTFHWVETHSRPFIDEDGRAHGTVTSFRAVDAEVAADAALRESEARYRLLAENGGDVVYQTDVDGLITWVSPAVSEALGWEPEQLIGTPSRDLIHVDDHAGLDQRRAEAGRDELLVLDSARYRTSHGDYRWMSIRARHVRDEDDDDLGTVVGLRDVTAEREAQEELAYRAFHDPLTGLHNRAWVLDMLDADLRAAARRGTRLGVLFIDLDNFKVVNDSLGHIAGDDVLAAIARRISHALRPQDRVGRFGGDEFVVVVPDAGETHELEAIAERLSRAITTELMIDQHRIVPTASIGIAVSTPASTSGSLLRDTDSALFRAKNAGRARWHFFDEQMHAQAVARLTIEDELRRAIDEHQFVVHYQPIVRLLDARVVGHEALVRWNHPTRGLLAPIEFLPVAEDSGLIVDIGHQVLHLVCELIAGNPGLPGPISVNKSPLQIARPGWRNTFVDILRGHGVGPSRIVIEVTETAVLDILEVTRLDFLHLRDLGVGIHVDDFGTGYSSISLLRDLPVTGLKLDGSFTSHLSRGTSPTKVLAAGLAGLAEGLHLQSIAEGVETEEQAEILRSQGWTHGQGWLFGRPAPVPALTSLVESVAARAVSPA